MPYCDQAPISSPFRDIGPQSFVRTHTHTLTHRHTPQSDFIFCPMQGIALDGQQVHTVTRHLGLSHFLSFYVRLRFVSSY